MKIYYFLLIFTLVLLTGCINYLDSSDTGIEKIYSVKDLKEVCSPDILKLNAVVIEKYICSCPDDPDISCDCGIFGGDTLGIGYDGIEIMEFSKTYGDISESLWNSLKESEEYLFTIKNGKIVSIEKINDNYLSIKDYYKICSLGPTKLKAEVIKKDICIPPAVEGVVFKCDIDEKLVIESGGQTYEFRKVNIDVKIFEKLKEKEKYILTLKLNKVVDAVKI